MMRMYRTIPMILIFVPLLAQQQGAAPCLARAEGERAYTRLRLMDVVRDQTPVRAEYLIRTCGIRVPYGPELEADLKEAGAEENVRTAVREGQAVAGPPGWTYFRNAKPPAPSNWPDGAQRSATPV